MPSLFRQRRWLPSLAALCSHTLCDPVSGFLWLQQIHHILAAASFSTPRHRVNSKTHHYYYYYCYLTDCRLAKLTCWHPVKIPNEKHCILLEIDWEVMWFQRTTFQLMFFCTLEVLVFHLLFKSQAGFQQSVKVLLNKNIFFFQMAGTRTRCLIYMFKLCYLNQLKSPEDWNHFLVTCFETFLIFT